MVTDSVQETYENDLFASYFVSVISFIWLSFAVIQYADLFYPHAFQVQVFVDGVCTILLVVLVHVFLHDWTFRPVFKLRMQTALLKTRFKYVTHLLW